MSEWKSKYHKTCEFCGKEYDGKSERSKYCSEECRREADKKRKFDRYPTRNKTCPVCGKPLPKFKTEFCSKDCEVINNQGSLHHSRPVKRICSICGKEFMGSTKHQNQLYCSDACRNKSKAPKPGIDGLTPRERLYKNYAEQRELKAKEKALLDKRKAEEKERAKEEKRIAELSEFKFEYFSEIRQCPFCNSAFTTYPYQDNQKYCSEKCQRYANKNSVHGHIKKRVKDEDQIIDKGITVRKLFNRDNGICYLCGEPCDLSDKTYITGRDGRKTFIAGPNYPSIDHVIPVSKGGLHSWDNVRLAHFKCNTLKRDNVI